MISILLPLGVSFLITLFLLPFWIKKTEQIGLIWEDMNKYVKSKIPGSGGIVVIAGFIVGTFAYVAYGVFYLNSFGGNLVEIFALTTVVLLMSMIGFVDDLLGWHHGGLSRRSRIIFVALAALPLVAINAGLSEINLPFFGSIDLGIAYPLIFIPLGIVGATTTFNFLAGMNGLEAGQGIIILSALGAVAFLTGQAWLAVISFCMIASLFAFLLFNFYPAKIFPGDSLTYAVGSLIAIMAIIGNFEKIAVFFFIPIILEVFLKGRGSFVKSSFGKPNSDGTLALRHDKIYSLNHLAIYLFSRTGIQPSEKRVVYAIWAFQIFVILIGFIVFRNNLFV